MNEKPRTPISVRLDGDISGRLSAIAKKAGVKPALLIRLSVRKFLDDVEKDGALIIQLQREKH